jgi:hypothetical protein
MKKKVEEEKESRIGIERRGKKGNRQQEGKRGIQERKRGRRTSGPVVARFFFASSGKRTSMTSSTTL